MAVIYDEMHARLDSLKVENAALRARITQREAEFAGCDYSQLQAKYDRLENAVRAANREMCSTGTWREKGVAAANMLREALYDASADTTTAEVFCGAMVGGKRYSQLSTELVAAVLELCSMASDAREFIDGDPGTDEYTIVHQLRDAEYHVRELMEKIE